jgi:hypothetical protein
MSLTDPKTIYTNLYSSFGFNNNNDDDDDNEGDSSSIQKRLPLTPRQTATPKRKNKTPLGNTPNKTPKSAAAGRDTSVRTPQQQQKQLNGGYGNGSTPGRGGMTTPHGKLELALIPSPLCGRGKPHDDDEEDDFEDVTTARGKGKGKRTGTPSKRKRDAVKESPRIMQ